MPESQQYSFQLKVKSHRLYFLRSSYSKGEHSITKGDYSTKGENCVNETLSSVYSKSAHAPSSSKGCFVYTEGIFAPKLCGQVVDVFLDRQL
jgi:hypothetical protein